MGRVGVPISGAGTGSGTPTSPTNNKAKALKDSNQSNSQNISPDKNQFIIAGVKVVPSVDSPSANDLAKANNENASAKHDVFSPEGGGLADHDLLDLDSANT